MSTAIFRGRTFASLQRHRNYRLYFFGQFISQAGTWLQGAAQAWLVLQLTHSAAAVGIVTFWQFGPYALVGLVGGPLTDRLDRRKTLVFTQAGQMLAAALLAALTFAHLITVWEIDLIAALRGIILVMDNPSRQAFVIQMVGREELPNAVALNSSVANATRILGPGIGGIIIAAWGVGVAFALNAVSYIAVIGALLLMREAELFATQMAKRASLLSSLREGLAYAWNTPTILLPLSMLFLISTFAINFSVLLPVLASQTLHANSEVYGFLTACFGAGALVGALIAASIGRATWKILLGAAFGYGVMLAILAPQRLIWAALLILVGAGVCYTLYTSSSNAMVQLSSPAPLQGRLMALYSYIFAGTSPLGALIAGGLAQRFGTEVAFLEAGVVAAATALGAALLLRGRGTPVLEQTLPDEVAAG